MLPGVFLWLHTAHFGWPLKVDSSVCCGLLCKFDEFLPSHLGQMNARNAYTLCGVDDIMLYAPISELQCMGEDTLCVNSILVRIDWGGYYRCWKGYFSQVE